MWKDPIVEEVRQASEELARRSGYDFETYNLRENEKKSDTKVVSRVNYQDDKELETVQANI